MNQEAMEQLINNVVKEAFKRFANLEVWDTVGQLLANFSGGENFDALQFELPRANKTLERTARKARQGAERCNEELEWR